MYIYTTYMLLTHIFDPSLQMSVANKLFSKWISEKLKISKQLIKIYKYSGLLHIIYSQLYSCDILIIVHI